MKNNWDMRDRSTKPFHPPKYKCTKCEDVIWSKYPGQLVSCKCGECYVDQTRDYMRLSGVLEMVEEGTSD